jgi:hypothetical protein
LYLSKLNCSKTYSIAEEKIAERGRWVLSDLSDEETGAVDESLKEDLDAKSTMH